AFADWLRLETMIEYEQHLQAIEKGESAAGLTPGKLLQAIQKAVNAVMAPSGWINIRYSASAQEVVAEHPEHGILPVSILSDGIRNMIGLLADIAYRAVRLNPHLGENAVIRTPGMVLIDEMDMHLHPEWQQLVLQDLTRAFPGIQFIVTTHSPQVISTVKKTISGSSIWKMTRLPFLCPEPMGKPATISLKRLCTPISGRIWNISGTLTGTCN
ncbi:MAG: AAA family ATPase, partial [Desulfobacteraceae bacterium]